MFSYLHTFVGSGVESIVRDFIRYCIVYKGRKYQRGKKGEDCTESTYAEYMECEILYTPHDKTMHLPNENRYGPGTTVKVTYFLQVPAHRNPVRVTWTLKSLLQLLDLCSLRSIAKNTLSASIQTDVHLFPSL